MCGWQVGEGAKISPRFFEQMPRNLYPELEEIYGIGIDAAGGLCLGRITAKV